MLIIGGNMMADKPSKADLHRINTGLFMKSINYFWSNDAQVYYHSSFQMPTVTRKQAEYWFDHRDILSGESFNEQ